MSKETTLFLYRGISVSPLHGSFVVGYNPPPSDVDNLYAGVAQLVEQRLCTPQVVRSNRDRQHQFSQFAPIALARREAEIRNLRPSLWLTDDAKFILERLDKARAEERERCVAFIRAAATKCGSHRLSERIADAIERNYGEIR